MQGKNQIGLLFFRKAATYGIYASLICFFTDKLVSDYTLSFLLCALSAGTFISSLFLFGFGLCLGLMEEAISTDQEKPKSWMERLTYHYWR